VSESEARVTAAKLQTATIGRTRPPQVKQKGTLFPWTAAKSKWFLVTKKIAAVHCFERSSGEFLRGSGSII
jgi:hypothetical protein